MPDPTKPYGDVPYADPGYQDDGIARYPLDTEEHVRAAWSFINQADNAARYTARQLELIKGRIKAAARRFGITIAEDENDGEGRRAGGLDATIDPGRIEHRTARLDVRADDGDETGRRFWIRALPYEVADSYRTTFARGAMGDVLTDPPVLLYGHDYMNLGNVLGRAIDAREGDDALDILFELDDPADVPAARQAAAQLRSGTLRRFSVGFERLSDEPDTGQGVTRITRARLLEVSIVLDPAVPGTGVLATRTTGQRVTLDLVREVAGYLRDGLIGRQDAQQLLAANTVSAEQPPATDEAPSAGDVHGAADAPPADDPTVPTTAAGPALGTVEGDPGPEPTSAAPEMTAVLADADTALNLVRSR